jgi:hydrogenase/urease accessory protein HupE
LTSTPHLVSYRAVLKRRPILTLSFLLAAASRVEAHPAPFSYLDLHRTPAGVHGAIVLHVLDVAHELAIDPPERLLDRQMAVDAALRIGHLLDQQLAVEIDGRPMAIEWGHAEPLRDRHAVRMQLRIPGARPGRLTVRSALFPYDPTHQTFVNIYDGDVLRQQAMLDWRGRERTFYAGTPQDVTAIARTFVPAGVHHILIGADHILFLVGLLLLGGSLGRLLAIVSAFTVGHSITLSLAALDIVTVPVRFVEPAIALSIVFVGADNLLTDRRSRDLRVPVALAFGLIHGFGFASVLRDMGLPGGAIGWSLFSFNLGVEIGQVLVVAVVATLLSVIHQRSEVMGRRVAVAGSLLVTGAGLAWFVQRVFLAGGVS